MKSTDSINDNYKILEKKYKALRKTSRMIHEFFSFKETAQNIFYTCADLLGATSGYVALLSDDGLKNEVLFLESGGRPCTVPHDYPMPIRGLRAESYKFKKVIYHNDFMNSQWVDYMPQGHVILDNVLFSPLVLDGKSLGIIGLANKPGGFTDDDANTALIYGELAAIALRNSRSLEDLNWNLKVNRTLSSIYSKIVSNDADIGSISKTVVREAQMLTQSEDGYVGAIDAAKGKLTIHTFTPMMEIRCAMSEKKSQVEFSRRGDLYPSLWGHCLNHQEPFFTNSPDKHEASDGLPEGHIQVKNYLSVPVFSAHKLIGQISLANKSEDYTSKDLEAVNLIGSHYAIAIQKVAAAEAIQKSESRYRELVEHIKDGIAVFDVNLNFSFVNRQMAQMLGFKTDELPGMALNLFVTDDSIEALHNCIYSSSENKIEPFEVELTGREGRQFYVMVSCSPIYHDLDVEAIFAIFTDVTRFRELEGRLEKARRLEAIGQLAAGIAHEINTPVQYIENNTKYLKETLTDLLYFFDRLKSSVERSKEDGFFLVPVDLIEGIDIDFIKEELPQAINENFQGLKRISSIVKYVKQLAYPGNNETRKEDINKTLQSVLDITSSEWKSVAEVEVDYDIYLPKVPIITGVFERAVVNIIINAVQAIKEKQANGYEGKGLIEISTLKHGEYVEIRIADSGIGIPDKIKDKIFDRFFTTKDVGKGTGQGLSICHKIIVDQHNGDISVESGKRKGATFVIKVPLSF